MHFNLFWHFSQSHTVECRVSFYYVEFQLFLEGFCWLSFFFFGSFSIFVVFYFWRYAFHGVCFTCQRNFAPVTRAFKLKVFRYSQCRMGDGWGLRSVGVAVCLKGSKYFCDVSIVNAERRLTIKERNKNEKYDRVAEHYDGRSP